MSTKHILPGEPTLHDGRTRHDVTQKMQEEGERQGFPANFNTAPVREPRDNSQKTAGLRASQRQLLEKTNVSKYSFYCSKTHDIKFTIATTFRGTVQWHKVYSLLCNHHPHPPPELLHLPKWTLCPH